MAQIITQENFDSAVLGSDRPMLLDFRAGWCGPCRTLAPILAQIEQEHARRVVIGKVNVDEQPQLAARFDVTSIPTVILFRGGVQCDMLVGLRPKQAFTALLD